MDVGISEIKRLKNYWTDFYAVFSKNIRVVRGRFLAIEIFDPTIRKKDSGQKHLKHVMLTKYYSP